MTIARRLRRRAGTNRKRIGSRAKNFLP